MRILVVHTSATGAGHRSAAESLVRALKEHPGVEAESFDTLTVTSGSLKGVQRKLALGINHVPRLARLSYDMAFDGSPLMGGFVAVAQGLKAQLSPEALQHIQDYQPDLIVSTQGEANAMLNYWKARGKLDAPVHSVLTDHLGDVRWAQDCIERYYVANERMVEDLGRSGVSPARVMVTGMPLKPEFSETPTESQAALRSRLGLDPALPTLVVSGGGLGMQPYAEIVRELQSQPYPVQIVCICAANEEELLALKETPSRHPVTALGKVDNMVDWLRASDIVVTKAGGLSTSEVMALGKPMLLHRPLAGMEEAQAERLAGEGAAVRVDNPVELAATVGSWLEDPTRLAQASAAATRLSRPDAARTIARAIVSSL